MSEFALSAHAKEMLAERNIAEEWVWRTINTPARKQIGNLNYTKAIKEKDGRVLRVVVNPNSEPRRIVTAFFDRRLLRKAGRKK